MKPQLRRLSALAFVLAVPSLLHASGFQLREQNPAAQGNSFAGVTAGAGGLGSMFFNPAILVPIDGMQVLAGFSSVAPRAELEGAAGTRSQVLPAPVRPISGPGSHPDAAKDAVIPNLGFVWSLSPDLKLGVSVNATYGLVTEYAPDFVGRYHGLKSDLKCVDLGVSGAYRVSERWAIGATVLYRKAEAELSTGVDWGLAGMAYGLVPGTQDGLATLEGSKAGIGYKVGVLFTPTQNVKVGLAHHAAMKMELSGTADYQFPSTLPAQLVAGFQAKGYRRGGGKADLPLPSVTSIGVDWQATPSMSIQGEAALTGWSTFKELRVRFDTGAADSVTHEAWKDAWFMSLGMTWKAGEAWTLRTGVAYDQSAVDDLHRTPRIPDADRTWISAGATWQAKSGLLVDFGYSHILVKDGTLNLEAGVDPQAPDFTRGTLRGTYRSGIDVLSLGARFTF